MVWSVPVVLSIDQRAQVSKTILSEQVSVLAGGLFRQRLGDAASNAGWPV